MVQGLKILFVTENGYSGGLDSFIITLVNNWPEAKDTLILMCNKNHPGLSVIKARIKRDLHIIAHDYPLSWSLSKNAKKSVWRKLGAPFRLLGRQILFYRYLAKFRGIFEDLQIDRLMCINGGYPAGLTCRAATVAWGRSGRRPLSIHNFHNFATSARLTERIFEDAIDRDVFFNAKALVSVSQVCLDSLDVRKAFAGGEKRKLIYNGIEFTAPNHNRMGVRKHLHIHASAPLLLMLGTYERRKGHEFLLQSFRSVIQEMPEAQLVICGFGYPQDVEHVRQLVLSMKLGNNVRLEHFRDDVADLLIASDILLVSSQNSESFGLTIVEAMSHGIPVIATRVGGIPEVLKDGEGGFLVESNDTSAFSGKILSLLKNKKLRTDQGKKGLIRYRKNFTAGRMAKEYADLIRET